MPWTEIRHSEIVEDAVEELLKDLSAFVSVLSLSGEMTWSNYEGGKWGHIQKHPLTKTLGAPIYDPGNKLWKGVNPGEWFGANEPADTAYKSLRSYVDLDMQGMIVAELGLQSGESKYKPDDDQLQAVRTRILDLFDQMVDLDFGLDLIDGLGTAHRATMKNTLDTVSLPGVRQGQHDMAASRKFGLNLVAGQLHSSADNMIDRAVAANDFQARESAERRKAEVLKVGLGQEQTWVVLEDLKARVALQIVQAITTNKENQVKLSEGIAADAAGLGLKHAAAGIELAYREQTWPIELRRYIMEAAASIGSGVPVRDSNETVMANVMSGALTGAGMGASMTESPGVGAGWGALIGGVSGLLG